MGSREGEVVSPQGGWHVQEAAWEAAQTLLLWGELFSPLGLLSLSHDFLPVSEGKPQTFLLSR